MVSMRLFAAATLIPGLMLGLAALSGGGWIWAALVWMTALTMGLDALVPRVPEAREGQEFPAADWLSAALALLHFLVLPLVVRAVAGAAGLDWPGRIGLALAAGLWFGQVSNSNAHELIHRTNRWLYGLGMWVYVSLLFGHHASAHRLVHHRHVGLPDDPNTARRGESFYRFAPRAWAGSFRAGMVAESRLRRGRGWHPYRTYILGAAAWLGLSATLAGWAGVAAHLIFAAHATMQLLLSDYVQHYGLTRASDGERPGMAGPELSWNSPHWFSSHLMLNAPRHSDHHSHPGRRFPELRLAPTGTEPMLPASLPVMATLALFPRLWRRVMNSRLAALGGSGGTALGGSNGRAESG